MLTLPVEAGRAAADRPARILLIGRSETVLSEAVTIMREKAHAEGATNDFDRTLDLFDAGQLDLVVFGGMVPPATKEHLREQISARNPAVAFVQGYAGIPGLIAAQAEAALIDGTTGPAASVTYDARSRSIGISLDRQRHVTVTAWWHTSFASPGTEKHLPGNPGPGTPRRPARHRDPGRDPRPGVIRHRVHRPVGPRVHRRAHAERDDLGTHPRPLKRLADDRRPALAGRSSLTDPQAEGSCAPDVVDGVLVVNKPHPRRRICEAGRTAPSISVASPNSSSSSRRPAWVVSRDRSRG